MIVEVVTGADERPEARVVDIEDLSRCVLALGQVTDEEAADVLERSGLGRLQDAGTAQLDAAALRAAAEPRATAADWSARWDEMVERARSEGRLSADGASIRVRVEPAAGG
jgi:outer membrane translocation and assembly module TamA